MANMRAIRTRIKSVKNTQQITKAMKMVAVSKLRRTQAGMAASRPFADKSQEIMNRMLILTRKKSNIISVMTSYLRSIMKSMA